MDKPTGLDSLPTDLLRLIYAYLPLEERSITMSRVARIWRLIAKDAFQELATQLLKDQFGNHNPDVNLVVALSKKNPIISPLKLKNLKCKIGGFSSAGGPGTFTSKKPELKKHTLSIYGESEDGYSALFPIYWNPSTQTLSLDERKGDKFRASYLVRVDVRKITHVGKCISMTFNLCAYPSNTEKKHFWSWNTVKEADVIPPNMDDSIKSVLHLQLKVYILSIVRLNMKALSGLCFQEDTLVVQCNSNGKILPLDNRNYKDTFTLTIRKEILENIIPILTWNASDYSIDKERFCNITALFRWTVYSFTTVKLAEKMGFEILEKPRF